MKSLEAECCNGTTGRRSAAEAVNVWTARRREKRGRPGCAVAERREWTRLTRMRWSFDRGGTDNTDGNALRKRGFSSESSVVIFRGNLAGILGPLGVAPSRWQDAALSAALGKWDERESLGLSPGRLRGRRRRRRPYQTAL